MKKIITTITIVLLCSSAGLLAQSYDRAFRETPSPTIYLAYQPWDHGLGLRSDYHINHWAGVYGSASYGQWGLYQQSGLGQHVKLTAGILIPYKDYAGGQFDFSLGLNYHKVWGEVVENEIFKDDPVFHKNWSFELGLTCKLKRFALGVRTDILRWEPCVDIGIPLNFKDRYRR